jgi:hypothetical protein
MEKELLIIKDILNVLINNKKEINKALREKSEYIEELHIELPNNKTDIIPIDIKEYHEKIKLNNILMKELAETSSSPNNLEKMQINAKMLKEVFEIVDDEKFEVELYKYIMSKYKYNDKISVEDNIKNYLSNGVIDTRFIYLYEFKTVEDIIDYFALDDFSNKFRESKFSLDIFPNFNKCITVVEKLQNNAKMCYAKVSEEIQGFRSICPDYAMYMEELFNPTSGKYFTKVSLVYNTIMICLVHTVCNTTLDKYLENIKSQLLDLVDNIKNIDTARDDTTGNIIKDF